MAKVTEQISPVDWRLELKAPTMPGQLTAAEIASVKDIVLAREYRHMPLRPVVGLGDPRIVAAQRARFHAARATTG